MNTEPWSEAEGVATGAEYPAVSISWEDIQEFVERLHDETGAAFRLPTEAEWEYGCRAGTTTLWSFGNDVSGLGDHAWSVENSGESGEPSAMPIGLKLPNRWGLHRTGAELYFSTVPIITYYATNIQGKTAHNCTINSLALASHKP